MIAARRSVRTLRAGGLFKGRCAHAEGGFAVDAVTGDQNPFQFSYAEPTPEALGSASCTFTVMVAM